MTTYPPIVTGAEQVAVSPLRRLSKVWSSLSFLIVSMASGAEVGRGMRCGAEVCRRRCACRLRGFGRTGSGGMVVVDGLERVRSDGGRGWRLYVRQDMRGRNC